MYVKVSLGDKEALQRSQVETVLQYGRGGIICPNAKETVNSCSFEGTGKYFMAPDDLDRLVAHKEVLEQDAEASIRYQRSVDSATGAFPSLTTEESDKLRGWLVEFQSRLIEVADLPENAAIARAEDEPLSGDGDDALIEATTKKCPKISCRNRESHYHGHDCHQ